MSDSTRRRLLAGAAGVGAAALAGCLGGDGGSGDGNGGDGPRLRHIDLINRDDVARTVHLQVERDGEVVYWDVHELDAPGDGGATSAMVEGAWEEGSGPFTIEARVDEGEVRTQSYAAAEADCIGVFAPVDGGEISFYNGAVDCETGATTTE